MKVKSMPLGPLETNCYVVYNDQSALIFDPGGEAERLEGWLQDANLTPIAILLTHAHFDHIGAVDKLRESYHIPVHVHKEESKWLEDATLNGSAYFPVGKVTTNYGPDKLLTMGEMNLGEFDFEIRYTPGHSPGGVVFIFHREKSIIGGDSLFKLGIGRTDLPGGDYNLLIKSIRNEIFTLPDDYTVYPGHGLATTIGEEKKHNPFLY